MDWDVWLGPAPWRPYNHSYVQGGWRGYYDFDSGARLLDWGAHTVDLCQWANQADATMPVEYEPTPNSVIAHYANGVKLVLDFLKTPFGDRPGWVQALGTCPVRFVGDEGWVEAGDSGGIEVSSASLRSELKHLETSPTTGGLDVSAHARNFFDCIKSRSQTRGQPASHAALAHRLPRGGARLDAGPQAHARPRSAGIHRRRPGQPPAVAGRSRALVSLRKALACENVFARQVRNRTRSRPRSSGRKGRCSVRELAHRRRSTAAGQSGRRSDRCRRRQGRCGTSSQRWVLRRRSPAR